MQLRAASQFYNYGRRLIRLGESEHGLQIVIDQSATKGPGPGARIRDSRTRPGFGPVKFPNFSPANCHSRYGRDIVRLRRA